MKVKNCGKICDEEKEMMEKTNLDNIKFNGGENLMNKMKLAIIEAM